MKEKINTIIHGNCIEELKKLPDNSIDLIFADPPYYLQLPKGKRLKRANGTEVIPVDDAWDKFEKYVENRKDKKIMMIFLEDIIEYSTPIKANKPVNMGGRYIFHEELQKYLQYRKMGHQI